MREIKFRGLTITDEWVYGDLVHDAYGSTCYYEKCPYRITGVCEHGHFSVPVKRGTVGQFTGLYDVNSKEIYEGDILVADGDDGRHGGKQYFQIMYGEGSGTVGFSPHCITGDYSSVHYEVWDKGEVIGNIHENPELLKEAE
jgi:hypothetical protein